MRYRLALAAILLAVLAAAVIAAGPPHGQAGGDVSTELIHRRFDAPIHNLIIAPESYPVRVFLVPGYAQDESIIVDAGDVLPMLNVELYGFDVERDAATRCPVTWWRNQ